MDGYAGNLVGALTLVGIAYTGGVFSTYPESAVGIATYKASHTFAEACPSDAW